MLSRNEIDPKCGVKAGGLKLARELSVSLPTVTTAFSTYHTCRRTVNGLSVLSTRTKRQPSVKAFHKDGIHDDHLRLIRRSPLIDELDGADRTADPRKPKSGMTQCQWYYPVKLPDELSTTNPKNRRPCFVYRINLVLI